jgi:hypothetical protein
MGNWKKITDKSELEGKTVRLKVCGDCECDELYNAYWNNEVNEWQFWDGNDVSCREWNGDPTHYKLVNK